MYVTTAEVELLAEMIPLIDERVAPVIVWGATVEEKVGAPVRVVQIKGLLVSCVEGGSVRLRSYRMPVEAVAPRMWLPSVVAFRRSVGTCLKSARGEKMFVAVGGTFVPESVVVEQ